MAKEDAAERSKDLDSSTLPGQAENKTKHLKVIPHTLSLLFPLTLFWWYEI